MARKILTAVAIAAIAGAIALVAPSAIAGSDGVDHVRVTDSAPAEVSPELLLQGFVASLAPLGVGSEQAQEAYVATCSLLDKGYAPEAIAGFLSRQAGLTRRQAQGAALAGQEFCAGWGTLGNELGEVNV